MESRRRRSLSRFLKWLWYSVLLIICTVLQTMPGLFCFGQAKPLYIMPLALAVAVTEDEFSGAIFGAVCGLMWDYTAGRTIGILAFSLLVLCFVTAAAVRLYLQCTVINFAVITAVEALYVLSVDFLFFYYMRGYSGAAERYLRAVLPTAALAVPAAVLLLCAVRFIHDRYDINSEAV